MADGCWYGRTRGIQPLALQLHPLLFDSNSRLSNEEGDEEIVLVSSAATALDREDTLGENGRSLGRPLLHQL
eukprot:6267968-Prorocentrum_lima.AAC.1